MRKQIAICIVLVASSACTTKRGYVDKGNAFYQQGKFADAEINYQKAIQKDRNYGDAYYHLGLAAMQEGNGTKAYNALMRADQLLPDNTEVKEKFGELCLEFYLKDPQRPQKLYQQLQQVSGELLARNPNSFNGLRLKGYLAYVDRKPQEAIAFFRKALQIQPDSASVTTALVQIMFENGQVQESEKLALGALGQHKDYGPLYDALYRIYSSSNRSADADRILRNKVDNNPHNVAYIEQLAALYAGRGNQQEMKNTLQRMLDDPKDFPNARLLVGDFYVQQKSYLESIPYYEEGARQHPDQKVAFQKRRLAALLAAGKYEDASRSAEQILKDHPKDEMALRIRADLLITAGGPENGSAALSILQDQLNNHPNDNDAALRFQLGRAYRLKGDLATARTEFSEAIRMGRDYPTARYELAEIALQQRRPNEALDQANAILAVTPQDQRARLLHARALASSDPERARAELAQLLKNSPKDKDLEVRLELASVAFQQRKYREVIDTLSQMESSGDPRVFGGLVASYTREGQIDKAIETANEGLKRLPNSTLIREQLVDSAALGGKFDLAISECRKLTAANPKSPAEWKRLGEIYELKGDQDQAIAAYRQLAALAPSDINAELTLGDALVRAARFDEAKTQYQTVLKAHPEDPATLNDLAFALAESGGNLDEALRLEQRALAKDPNQPAFSDTMGYIYLKKGQNDSAMQTFGSLVRKFPHFASFRYHLGLVMFQTGDKASAKKQLEGALADHPSQQDKIRIQQLLAKIS